MFKKKPQILLLAVLGFVLNASAIAGNTGGPSLEAKAKAEAEAKAKAESEAKAKAESEAKAKAESEAKAKAESEAKAKAESEAKAKAESEAKAKAESEAEAETETIPSIEKEEDPLSYPNLASGQIGSPQSVTLEIPPNLEDKNTTNTVPEPATLALVGLGLAGMRLRFKKV